MELVIRRTAVLKEFMAGSALIQACEAAGATIPRYVHVCLFIVGYLVQGCFADSVTTTGLSTGSVHKCTLISNFCHRLAIAGNCR